MLNMACSSRIMFFGKKKVGTVNTRVFSIFLFTHYHRSHVRKSSYAVTATFCEVSSPIPDAVIKSARKISEPSRKWRVVDLPR